MPVKFVESHHLFRINRQSLFFATYCMLIFLYLLGYYPHQIIFLGLRWRFLASYVILNGYCFRLFIILLLTWQWCFLIILRFPVVWDLINHTQAVILLFWFLLRLGYRRYCFQIRFDWQELLLSLHEVPNLLTPNAVKGFTGGRASGLRLVRIIIANWF